MFRLGSKPWINSDGSNQNDIIDTIRQCPSGALSYSIDGVEYRDPEEQRNPTITVLKNGPYHITGGVELIGENIQFGEGASIEHSTLCRCGASKNKPFCDGEHRKMNYKFLCVTNGWNYDHNYDIYHSIHDKDRMDTCRYHAKFRWKVFIWIEKK